MQSWILCSRILFVKKRELKWNIFLSRSYEVSVPKVLTWLGMSIMRKMCLGFHFRFWRTYYCSWEVGTMCHRDWLTVFGQRHRLWRKGGYWNEVILRVGLHEKWWLGRRHDILGWKGWWFCVHFLSGIYLSMGVASIERRYDCNFDVT